MIKLKIYLQILLIKNLLYRQFRNISTRVIYAQAVHETGNFTSGVFLKGNNLFGMQPNSRKWDDDSPERIGKEGSATYSSRYQSIRDYFDRQLQFKVDLSNDGEYMLSTLRTGYATDPNYLTAWQAQYLKVPRIQNNILYALAIIVTAFIVWRLKKGKS
ncbi:glucosaminidase domain-containing protein [Roseivirga thermotolerans]|nr:glucosaminidase domain-containing protein [Roseivirga thermotolerans]